jgi:hypothetical protein
MTELLIAKTKNTPSINFNPQSGCMKIEGRAIPEDPNQFFSVLVTWLDQYFESAQKLTKFEIQLEYVNSGSSKFLLGILQKVKKYHENGSECVVNWYYEEDDESLLELGEHFKSCVKMPFNLIATFE